MPIMFFCPVLSGLYILLHLFEVINHLSYVSVTLVKQQQCHPANKQGLEFVAMHLEFICHPPMVYGIPLTFSC